MDIFLVKPVEFCPGLTPSFPRGISDLVSVNSTRMLPGKLSIERTILAVHSVKPRVHSLCEESSDRLMWVNIQEDFLQKGSNHSQITEQ